jgi:U4/U6.U5 tri-snRNP-associated protein 2
MNLDTLKIYLLPEGHEVIDESLEDIKYVVNPFYTPEQVAKIDKESRTGHDLANKPYVPGKFFCT